MILFPSNVWKFFTVVEDGVDVIESWYEGETFEAQIAFDKLLKQNVKTENALNWVGYRHRMGNKLKGVFELEFTANKRANRLLCTFNGPKKMVMLCGCYHKGNLWTPAGSLEKTRRRVEKVRNGTATLRHKEIEVDR